MARMKKLISLMLGLSFIGSTVTIVLADEAATTKTIVKETVKKKNKGNKTVETKTIKKETVEQKTTT